MKECGTCDRIARLSMRPPGNRKVKKGIIIGEFVAGLSVWPGNNLGIDGSTRKKNGMRNKRNNANSRIGPPEEMGDTWWGEIIGLSDTISAGRGGGGGAMNSFGVDRRGIYLLRIVRTIGRYAVWNYFWDQSGVWGSYNFFYNFNNHLKSFKSHDLHSSNHCLTLKGRRL